MFSRAATPWLLVIAMGCQIDGPPEAGTPATKAAKPAQESYSSGAEVAQRRSELDEKVWADEVLAQRYERTFVDLWDTLREAPDPLAVLAQFPLETIELPPMGSPETVAPEIRSWAQVEGRGVLIDSVG